MAISFQKLPKRRLLLVGIAVAVIMLGILVWQVFSPKDAATVKREVVAKVAKLYNLPTDEEPRHAVIADADQTSKEPFFKDAKNGDQLLVYPQAGFAVLYRESENKIINTGKVGFAGEPGEAPKQQPDQVAKVTVKVVNGTTKTGRASAVGGELASKLPQVVTVDQTFADAKKKPYAKTLVVDLNGNKADAAKQIANALGGEVGNLPAGEGKPGTDILVIVGQ